MAGNFAISINFTDQNNRLRMAMYLWAILILSVSMIIPDRWFFLKMKKHNFYRWFRLLSLVPLVIFIAAFFYIRFGLRNIDSSSLTARIAWIFVIILMIYIPKVLYIIFYYINWAYQKIFNVETRFFRIFGFGLGILFVSLIFNALLVTTSDFHVKHQSVEVEALPSGFDGYKIAVIADFHLGNWNKRFSIMDPILRLVNEQQADMIVFAGDMINNYESEFDGWQHYFLQLKAKNDLKYAVLGNHDYGDYTNWKTDEAKQKNLENVKQNIRDLGFRLLLNEHEMIVIEGDTIVIVGVENFGSGYFDKYSDLPEALSGANPQLLKVLISHDPNHWLAEVVDKHPDIFLTISGHTHAGQLGLIHNKIKISPASLIYPNWDGLYRRNQQYLYVNRGIGFVGVPMRIGVPPEITVIELKKAK